MLGVVRCVGSGEVCGKWSGWRVVRCVGSGEGGGSGEVCGEW